MCLAQSRSEHVPTLLWRRRPLRGLHLSAYALDFPKHAQQVSAQNLPDVVCGVASVQQGLGDLRQVGGGVDPCRGRAADAVEVRTQADVIDSCDFGDVIDVVDEGLEGRTRDLGDPFPLDVVFVEIGEGFPRREFFASCISTAASRVFGWAFDGLRKLRSSKPEKKFTCTTPPFLATARSMSSVMLRGWFVERAG